MKDYGVADPLADKAVQASKAFSTSSRDRFLPGAATGEAQAFFTAGTQTIEAVTAYQHSAVANGSQLLQARLDTTLRMFWLTALGSGLCVLIMLYFMLSFHLSFICLLYTSD